MARLYPISITLSGTKHSFGSLDPKKQKVVWNLSLKVLVTPRGTGRNRQFGEAQIFKIEGENRTPVSWCAPEFVNSILDSAYDHDQYLIDDVKPGDVFEVRVFNAEDAEHTDETLVESFAFNVTGFTVDVDAAEYSHIKKVISVGTSQLPPRKTTVARNRYTR